MLISTADELYEYVGSRYTALGRPVELTPFVTAARTSNSLWRYTATEGRFLLKIIAHPAALYGQSSVAERLEIVARALCELHHAGLPVEQIVAEDSGRFVHVYEAQLLRLYAFDDGQPFADPRRDTPRAARSLHRLHAEGLGVLSDATRIALESLQTLYPLRTTAPELPRLNRFVAEHAVSDATYAAILRQWPLVEWAVDESLAYMPAIESRACVAHTDFHPDNALFSDARAEATMIDCDNMVIGRRLSCLGFAILRFGFYRRRRTGDALSEALAVFAPQERHDRRFMSDLVHSMIYLEVEKVARILHRVRTTGQYAGFVENICPIHLANIRLLRGSFLSA